MEVGDKRFFKVLVEVESPVGWQVEPMQVKLEVATGEVVRVILRDGLSVRVSPQQMPTGLGRHPMEECKVLVEVFAPPEKQVDPVQVELFQATGEVVCLTQPGPHGLRVRVSAMQMPESESESGKEDVPRPLMPESDSGSDPLPLVELSEEEEIKFWVLPAFMERDNPDNQMKSKMALARAKELQMSFYVVLSVPSIFAQLPTTEGFKQGIPLGIYLARWEHLPTLKDGMGSIQDLKKFPATQQGHQDAEAHWKNNFAGRARAIHQHSAGDPDYFLHPELKNPVLR